MNDRIRFHFDEHVDPRIAAGLRRHGVDVTTTVEAGLRTQPDFRHFEYAVSQRRVLVTRDKDFLRMAGLRPDHPGIAYYGARPRTIGQIIDSLVLIYEVLLPADMIGRIEFL